MVDGLQNRQKLFVIKTIHTFIYEGLVFWGNGMKCPLTALAKQYGDPKGYVGDIFLPEKIAKNTFRIFGTILVIGLLILLLDVFKIR